MGKKYVISFLIFIISVCAERAEAIFCFERIYLLINTDNSCSGSTGTIPPPVIGCGDPQLVDSGNCAEIWEFCCDEAIVNNYEDVSNQMQIITGVTFGEEAVAAEAAFDNFIANIPEDICYTGYQKSGFMAGYVYETYLDVGDTSEVNLSMWKRVACSKSGVGDLIPIQSISGSGGSGGLTQQETTDAVRSAIDTSTGVSGIQTTLNSIDSKTGTGSGGTGLNQAQTTQAVSDGLNNSLGTAPSSLGVGTGVSKTITISKDLQNDWIGPRYETGDLPDRNIIDFKNRFENFFDSMKSTNDFFQRFTLSPLADVPGGSSAFSFSAGRFGNINFDFAQYGSVFNYIKGFVLLLGSYLALRVMVLKR